MSRERFFLYGFLGAFVWCTHHPFIALNAALTIDRVDFFPGYLFTALSTFSWVSAGTFWSSRHDLITQCSSVGHLDSSEERYVSGPDSDDPAV